MASTKNYINRVTDDDGVTHYIKDQEASDNIGDMSTLSSEFTGKSVVECMNEMITKMNSMKSDQSAMQATMDKLNVKKVNNDGTTAK